MENQNRHSFAINSPPWQIWLVVALLALEGINNFFMIMYQPMALLWLGFKVLFIIGLIKPWRWVYVLFIAAALYHVLIFGIIGAFFVAIINLILVVFALWAFRYYFPRKDDVAADEKIL